MLYHAIHLFPEDSRALLGSLPRHNLSKFPDGHCRHDLLIVSAEFIVTYFHFIGFFERHNDLHHIQIVRAELLF